MHYLAKAGHAPSVFAKVWPNTERAKKEGVVVPWVGVLVVVGFSAFSFMAMRPHQDLASDPEKVRRTSEIRSRLITDRSDDAICRFSAG